MKEKKMGGNGPKKVSTGLGDDETVVAQRAQVLAILAMTSSARGNKHRKFVSRDFNAVINIR
jgi:hypothetical protein